MRTPSARYLTVPEAVVHFCYPSASAFYEFVRRRKHAFRDAGAVLNRGRVLLIDPIAFAQVLRDLQAGRVRLRRIA
jgi:hypothetical protein